MKLPLARIAALGVVLVVPCGAAIVSRSSSVDVDNKFPSLSGALGGALGGVADGAGAVVDGAGNIIPSLFGSLFGTDAAPAPAPAPAMPAAPTQPPATVLAPHLMPTAPPPPPKMTTPPPPPKLPPLGPPSTMKGAPPPWPAQKISGLPGAGAAIAVNEFPSHPGFPVPFGMPGVFAPPVMPVKPSTATCVTQPKSCTCPETTSACHYESHMCEIAVENLQHIAAAASKENFLANFGRPMLNTFLALRKRGTALRGAGSAGAGEDMFCDANEITAMEECLDYYRVCARNRERLAEFLQSLQQDTREVAANPFG